MVDKFDSSEHNERPDSLEGLFEELKHDLDDLKSDSPELRELFEEIVNELEEIHKEVVQQNLKAREELPEPVKEQLADLEKKISQLEFKSTPPVEQLPADADQETIDRAVAKQAGAQKQQIATRYEQIVQKDLANNDWWPNDAFSQRVLKPTLGRLLQWIARQVRA